MDPDAREVSVRKPQPRPIDCFHRIPGRQTQGVAFCFFVDLCDDHVSRCACSVGGLLDAENSYARCRDTMSFLLLALVRESPVVL